MSTEEAALGKPVGAVTISLKLADGREFGTHANRFEVVNLIMMRISRACVRTTSNCGMTKDS